MMKKKFLMHFTETEILRILRTFGIQKSSPKGTTIHWIPDVDESIKPVLFTRYKSIDAAFESYKEYAKKEDLKLENMRRGQTVMKFLTNGLFVIKKASYLRKKKITQTHHLRMEMITRMVTRKKNVTGHRVVVDVKLESVFA